ncbi:hypothetical protein R2APBS1_2841 [Rhodanobacter denitrificans]|uniref:Uncharacterized protein n=1 Tax=Rhodanobacter denitrificans TaxID=666685 RepID=M4NJQ7_9GAMM|nr:hypothetical protein R2APBS1_2841 [Rhodanobacter denitrificans]
MNAHQRRTRLRKLLAEAKRLGMTLQPYQRGWLLADAIRAWKRRG